ncbi:MAG: N-acetylmuramoyl-L-alanine amidase [Pelosinus sp.]|nr:N-acetylmuramoyl-L-alanine amidase [Pelosinus sp.]
MTKIVCIDSGHGGSDPGACGNDLRECDITLDVAQKVKGYLEDVGYQVVMTRDTDADVAYPDASASEELQARCDVSDNANADICVSIHCNSAGSDAALGTETFYCLGSVKGGKLAQFINNQITDALGTVDRGIKDNPLYITRHTDAVAALAELAFISNSDDAALLANEAKRLEFAAAVARGITDYFTWLDND